MMNIIGKWPTVRIGKLSRIGDFCIIVGEDLDGEIIVPQTWIGDYANIRSHTIIYGGVNIGDGFATGHFVLIRENCRIGDDVSIGSHSDIENGVTIGNRVRIHSNVFIPEHTVIEDDAWIGPCAIFTNDKYLCSPDAGKKREGVTVQSGAVVGAGAVILPGITIGAGALVGAGAVVTKDVKPGSVVRGNPARPLKRIVRCPDPNRFESFIDIEVSDEKDTS